MRRVDGRSSIERQVSSVRSKSLVNDMQGHFFYGNLRSDVVVLLVS